MKKQFQKNTKMVVNHAMKELENKIIFLDDFIARNELSVNDEKQLLDIKDFINLTVKNVKKKVGII